MTFITHASFRYFNRAGSCFLEMADPGWQTIPPVCSEIGRAMAVSALAVFSVLWAPLIICQARAPRDHACNVGFLTFKERG